MLAILLMRPLALVWAPAVVVVVLLYLRTIRPPRVEIDRPYLWRQVLGEPQSAARKWSRRRNLSIALHVAVVLLLTLAAADPCLRRPRTVVLVIDNSPSMSASDADGTRLVQAKAMAHEVLDSVGPREKAMVLTTAGASLVACPPEENLLLVRPWIDKVATYDGPSRVAEAVQLAWESAREDTWHGRRSDVHLFSDGCFDGSETTDLDPNVTIHSVGSDAGNAAVTRLAARRYANEPRQFQALVEVANRSGRELTASLRLLLDEEIVKELQVTIKADAQETMAVDVESESTGQLVAVLDWPDALADDNRLEVSLPPPVASENEAFSESRIAERAVTRTQSPAGWAAEPAIGTSYAVRPLWPVLLLAALALTVAEWVFYHRRWTC